VPKPLAEIEQSARELGKVIGGVLPDGVGFLLVLYDYGTGGHMSYMSNGRREDCIKLLAELREKLLSE
jgi:hypothetical protein